MDAIGWIAVRWYGIHPIPYNAMGWDEMKRAGVGCHRFCREDGEGKGGGRGKSCKWSISNQTMILVQAPHPCSSSRRELEQG